MDGSAFFYAVLIAGIGLFGFSGIATLRAKQWELTLPEAAGLRLALEFSFGAMLFALLPFFLHATLTMERVIWQLSSLLLMVALSIELGRVMWQALRLNADWDLPMIALLGLSSVLLAAELINVVAGWLPLYEVGLLWWVILAAIQYGAYTIAARRQPVNAVYHIEQVRPPELSPLGVKRATNTQLTRVVPVSAQSAREHQPHTHRMAFTRPRSTTRKPIPHATVRDGQLGAAAPQTPRHFLRKMDKNL